MTQSSAASAGVGPTTGLGGFRRSQRVTRARKTAGEIVLLAAAYVAFAYLGLQLGAAARFATLVWVPAGLSLAVLLWRGARLWPGVMIGAFVVNLFVGGSVAVALAISAGNTAEQLLAYTLLTRHGAFRPELARIQDVVALVTFGAISSPVVSASVGVAALWLAEIVPAGSIPYVWYVWWTGDALGILVIAPLVLTWIARPYKHPVLEDFAIWIAVSISAVVVFGEVLPARLAYVVPSSYLVFPPLIWGALRRGPRSTATSIGVLSTVAVTAALLGHGRFAGISLTDRLLAFATFTAVVAITVLLLSAAIAEKKARDQLIWFASHELRNPLGTLTLHYELLRQAVSSGLSREQLEAGAARAQRSLARLTQLVDEVLDVSRAGESPVGLRRAEMDLRELVEVVAGRLAFELEQNGSQLQLKLEPTIGRWDRSRLDQVITNLIGNASKHGGAGPIEVTLFPTDGVARLEVRDHGAGISAADQKRIFEPFVRLARSSDAIGMGLGLAIAREIVDAHRGRIWVESQPGAGSRFIVELPRF